MTDSELHKRFECLFDDVGSEVDFPIVRPLLAHYTSLANLENILITDELWFSNPLLMNDLEEVRFGILRGFDLVQMDESFETACGSLQRAQQFRECFTRYFREFEEEHAFDTYVFCLSEHSPADWDGPLSMWRGYGSNGNGVAVVFDSSKLEAVEQSPLIIARVRYGSEDDRMEWLKRTLRRCGELVSLAAVPDDKLYIPAYYLFERIKLFALFSKHSGFSEEREWRVVYAPDRDNEKRLAPMLHYSIGPRGAEPRLRLKIGPVDGITGAELSLTKLVDRIILGPTLSSPLASKAVLRMLERLERQELKERVRSSTIPFRPR
jgi:hypothetical protein